MIAPLAASSSDTRHEEAGGVTPPLGSLDLSRDPDSGPLNDNANPSLGTGLVVASSSANLELASHSAQHVTPPEATIGEEEAAKALLKEPSLAFNPHLRPATDTSLDHFAKALVDELGLFARSTGLPKHRHARIPADRHRFNASLEALTCNLILASVTGARHLTLWLNVQAEVRNYNGDCTGEPFRNAIDLMETFGFMRLIMRGIRTSNGLSFPSRFAIGDAFTERWRSKLGAALDLSSIRDINERSKASKAKRPLLVLKSAHGNVIDFTETARTKEMRSQVERFNRILAETPLAISSSNIDGGAIVGHTDGEQQRQQQWGRLAVTVINPAQRSLQRVFNKGSWREGGRFFGGFWQLLHREDRYRVLRLGNSFNKRRSPGFAFEEIANVDYRQLYPRLAYLEKNLPPPDRDLYLIPSFEDCRDGLKVLVNAMLFLAKPLDHWPRNTLVHFPKGTLLRDVRDAIMAVHWPIHDLFEKDGIGHRLAFIESQMLVHTLRHLWSTEQSHPRSPAPRFCAGGEVQCRGGEGGNACCVGARDWRQTGAVVG